MQRKTTKRSAKEPSQPGEISWRRPPARSRKQMRRNASSTDRISTSPTRKANMTAQATGRPVRRIRVNIRLLLQRVLFVILMAGLLAGLVSLLQLPAFRVSASSTQIGGVQRTTPEELFRRSGVDGRNIFLIRSEEIAQRVKEIEGVEWTSVHIRLPNQVIIDIRERVPLVAWQSITETVWFASDGRAVPQVGEQPYLHLVDHTGASIDQTSALRSQMLGSLLSLHEMRPDVLEVSYGSKEGLYFQAPEGWQAWLGHGGSMEAKLSMLSAMIDNLRSQGLQPQVIDLRFSERQAIWW